MTKEHKNQYIRHTIMRLLALLICLFPILCNAPAALSQQPFTTSAPIRIEADRMETSQEKSVVVFSGHVKAEQDDLVIKADAMTVRYSKTGSQQDRSIEIPAEGLSQQIDKITAKGNVEIVQGEWIATGGSMDYNSAEKIVILSGNARAWQDQNMVSGEKIILYLKEGRSVVERGAVESKRVKAFIYPEAQEDKNDNPSQEQ